MSSLEKLEKHATGTSIVCVSVKTNVDKYVLIWLENIDFKGVKTHALHVDKYRLMFFCGS